MAKTLKRKIAPLLEECIVPEDILKIKLQSRLRKEAKKILPTPEDRKQFLTSLIDHEEVNRLLGEDDFESAEKLAKTLLDGFLGNTNERN